MKVWSAELIPWPDHHFTARRVLAAGGRVLIVEHMLKRSRGHGITPVEAERLADALQERGYASSGVDSMTLGRAEYLVISATT